MVTGQVSKMMGASVKRKEDPRLITGQGKYTDDVQLRNMAYLAILRSPHAHAHIRRVDATRALQHPDVLAVAIGQQINQQCQTPFPLFAPLPEMKVKDRWPMATDKVTFVGELVAAVVARSREAARDALELIQVDYAPLPAIVDLEKGTQPGSPLVHDELGTNLCYEATASAGDPNQAFIEADGVVSARMEQPRLIPNPMEPRAVVASYERSTGNMNLWVTTQNPHIERSIVAGILGFPENKLRVVAIDVGGGFGCKINTYPESIVACILSRQLGRPVKWTEERYENFISTSHGRGQVQYVEAAYKNDGTLLGMRLRIYADLGAYCQVLSHAIPTLTPSMAPGVYRLQNLAWTTYGVYTNKVPYDAYRGAGRPEGAYIIERVMDLVARELNMDPVEVRRRNFIPKEAFPYNTPTGMQYDSGDYEAALSKALQIAGYDQLREEQQRLRQQGEFMGIGVTTTTEICGFGPAASLGGLGGFESGLVRIDSMGKVTVLTGSSPHGQGEETSFAQIVAEQLQVPFEDVEVIHGDTSIVPRGVGTFGSRSLVVGGTAIINASHQVKEKATQIAAALLKIEPQHVVLEGGVFLVEDIPGRHVTWADVGKEAYDARNLPPEVERGLEATSFWEPPNLTFPFSAHVAVVHIDRDTGVVKLTKYVSVDDCGTVINPMLVEGQVHGGIAQGVGQALLEEAVWDENGQLITGSYMDYAMPLAEEFPMFTLDRTVTPSPHNPMGAKGIGEMATIASTPTIVSAVTDALAHLGVTHIDIPLKSEKVWRILKEKGLFKAT
jgi:carbon-monoxide dehydrogenase large subunit